VDRLCGLWPQERRGLWGVARGLCVFGRGGCAFLAVAAGDRGEGAVGTLEAAALRGLLQDPGAAFRRFAFF